jgi:hypothetical protein
MSNRVTRFIYAFPTPFKLTGMGEICAAGEYEITTEEEPIGDFIVPAYRRISTTIYIPPPVGQPGIGQIIEIDPGELMAPVLTPLQAFPQGSKSRHGPAPDPILDGRSWQ